MLEDANSWVTRTLNKAMTDLGPLMAGIVKMPAWMMPFHFPGLWHTQALTK